MNFLTADVVVVIDAKKLPQQLKRAETVVTRSAVKMQKAFKRMGAAFKTVFTKMVRVAKWAGAGIAAALFLTTRAAMKQEDALFLLNAALKISGEFTDELSQRFQDFAAEIQQITIYGDEFVLSLMQQQKSLGVSADSLELAAKMAIGLATATGRGIESMSMYVALAMQGEFTMLRRYIPALRATTDATEQLAIVTAFAADGFKLAEEQAKTTSGALKQMWNVIGDVAEIIGKPFLESIRKSALAIKDWLGENQEKLVEKVGEAVSRVVSYAEALTEQLGQVNIGFLDVDTSSIDWALNMSRGLRTISMGIAYIQDGLKTVKAFALEISAVFLAIARDVIAATATMINMFQTLYNVFGADTPIGRKLGLKKVDLDVEILKTYALALDEEADKLAKRAGELLLAPLATTKVREFFAAVKKGFEQKIAPPDFVTTFPEVIKFEREPFSWENQTEGIKEFVLAGKEALAGARQMIDALDDEYKLIGKGSEARERAIGQARFKAELLSIENLSLEQRNLLTDEYSEKLDRNLALQRELNDELDKRLTGFAALNDSIKIWMKQAGDWGKNLGNIITNAFDTMADSLADALMGMAMDWKAFGRMFIKQILAMIIEMQMLYVWQLLVGAPGTGAAVKTTAPTQGLIGFGGNLFGKAPSGQFGGVVTQTGLAKIHKGEVISGVNNEMGFGDIIVNNYVSDTIDVEVMTEERVINISRKTSMQSAAFDGTYRDAHGIGD